MFDRGRIRFKPLSERPNKVVFRRDSVHPDDRPEKLDDGAASLVRSAGDDILAARKAGASIILAFGAHTIKNGMTPVLKGLIEDGWVTHLATNGAGIIHDWEFAFQGETSEDVRANVSRGEFGIWEETGYYINLALAVGAYRGLGYGESVGALVQNDGLEIPEVSNLEKSCEAFREDPMHAAAAADLLYLVKTLGVPPGFLPVRHRFPEAGLQAAAFALGVPFTGHPMFGHDIIYTHPANLGAAVGRTAERDFLSFAESISGLDGGVYLSVGSAVMSPMIFEKSLSMVQNLRINEGSGIIRNHRMYVVDLAKPGWDWNQGEPPPENPAYFLRFMKTFHRMGGRVEYISGDNRAVLLALYQYLSSKG